MARPHTGGPSLLSSLMAFRAAVVAAVYLGIVLACFPNGGLRGSEVALVDSILYIRQPSAGRTVNLVVTIRLGVRVNVEPHELVLLLQIVQAPH